MQSDQHFIVGISGASGAVYGIRMLEVLGKIGFHTHLIMSRSAHMTLASETEFKVADVEKLAGTVHSNTDIGAICASGSFRMRGMVIAPCSVKTLAEIANAPGGTLLSRAADVTLKERRRLVLMLRETPLHLGHIELMAQATRMGAIVMPPVPAFYHRPQTIADLVDQSVGRALDLFDLDAGVVKRWKEPPQAADG